MTAEDLNHVRRSPASSVPTASVDATGVDNAEIAARAKLFDRFMTGGGDALTFAFELGPCCCCERSEADGVAVIHAVMLDARAPLAGRGWGCVLCRLDHDGALAVYCDECFNANATPKLACRGIPWLDGRVAIAELEGRHRHDDAKHQQLTRTHRG